MSHAGWALQKAVFSRLSTDGPLTTALGGARVFDDVPRGIEPPYVTIGESVVRDWTTATEDGHEHALTISVWTPAAGLRDVWAILARVSSLLHDAPLVLDGHRLVNIRHEFSGVRRDATEETSRALVRFRAVTEPTS
ncbi:MAG: DUF3168 domain-containing protein [Hyphomicrobium sp.]|nr:DUF3168 domain-containing protein [Hyphomicrobium sp.]